MIKRRLKKTYKPMLYVIIGTSLLCVLLSQAMNVFSRKDEVKRLEQEIVLIKKEKTELEKEVELLNDDDYVTRYARENYVFTRDGEQVVTLPEVDE